VNEKKEDAMEVLERLGLGEGGVRKTDVLYAAKPIVFPVRCENPKLGEFFSALEKYREVRYSWKFGKLVVRGCEPVSNAEFALALGRLIPSVEDMLAVFAVSEISYNITETKGYISDAKAKDLEMMLHMSCPRFPVLDPLYEKRGLERILRFGGEYLTIRGDIKPISFPVKARRGADVEFFRVLQNMKKKHLTYNWDKSEMYILDEGDWEHPKILTISQEVFAHVVKRAVETSAEMIALLAISNITFVLTGTESYFSEETKGRLLDFTDRLSGKIKNKE